MDLFTDMEIMCDLLEASSRRHVPVYLILDEEYLKHFVEMCNKMSLTQDSFPVSVQLHSRCDNQILESIKNHCSIHSAWPLGPINWPLSVLALRNWIARLRWLLVQIPQISLRFCLQCSSVAKCGEGKPCVLLDVLMQNPPFPPSAIVHSWYKTRS